MAKNTNSNAFRRIDVDQFNEDNFRDEDGTSSHAENSPDVESEKESQVGNLLSNGHHAEALRLSLANAPIGNKNQEEKVWLEPVWGFCPVWPDLATFCHFGKILRVLGNVLRVYLVLWNILSWIPGLIKEGGTCCGMGMSGTYKYGQPGWNPGTDPIKILQRKFYATQFFQDFDWLKIFRIQSECLKNFIA